MRTFYRIDSIRDGTPIGLFCINHDREGEMTSFETFNRRTGKWVDDPAKAAYILQGEPGATMISEGEAADLEKRLFRP